MTSGTKERVELREALNRLVHECRAVLAFEVELREISVLGNTNVNVFKLRIEEAEAALAAVEREGAQANEAGIAEGMRMCAEFLEREADANFMPNEPAKQLIRGMATAIRVNTKAFAIGERTAQSPVAPEKEGRG